MRDTEIEFKSVIGDAMVECPEFEKGKEILDNLIHENRGSVDCASVLINAFSLLIQSSKPEARPELVLVLEKATFAMRHADWNDIDKMNEEEGGK
jgi:hypothetical protein